MANWDVTTAATPLTYTAYYTFLSKPGIVLVDSNHVLVTHGDSSGDGIAQVFTVNTSTWAVTTANTSLEFDTADCDYVDLVAIDTNHFLNVWTGPGSDGWAQVLTVNTTTWAVTTANASLEFDTAQGTYVQAEKIDDNHFMVVWAGNGNDGFAQVFTVNTTTWAVTTAADRQEWNASNSTYNSTVKVDTNHFMVVSAQLASDGFAQVLTVNTTTWAVTTSAAAFEFDTQDIYFSSVIEVDPTHYLVFWQTANQTQKNAQVLTVNTTTWAVTTAAALTSIDPDAGSSIYDMENLVQIDTNHFLSAYTYTTGSLTNPAYNEVFEVNTTTWAVSTVGAKLAVDASENYYSSNFGLAKIDTSHYFMIWISAANDLGRAQVLNVEVPSSGTNVTVNADVVTTTTSLPTPTITTTRNVTVSADVVSLTASLPAPTVTAVKNASVTADVVTLTTSLPAPTITTTSNATISADVVTHTTSLPTPTITAIRNATTTADVVTGTFSLPAPIISTESTVNVTVNADVVTGTLSLPAPTVTAVKNVSITADVVTGTLSLPEPTVSAIKNTTTTPDPVVGTLSLPAPTVATTRSVTITADVVTLTSSLPVPTAGPEVSTLIVYPDAHTETDTVDGYTEKANANYTTATTGDATAVYDSTDGSVATGIQHSLWSGTYYIRRPIVLFNTSDLGAGATITSATLSIYCVIDGGTGNADSDSINIVSSDPASNTSLAVGDHDSFGTTSFGSITIPTSTSEYKVITLNASGLAAISKTGITKFGLITGRDISDTAPTGLNQVIMYFSERGTDYRPKLTIEYTTSSATNVTVTADVVTGTVSLPTPAVSTIKNTTVSADVVTLTTSLPTPTITSQTSTTQTPDPVTGTLSLPAPTVATTTNITISADVVALTSSLPAPTISAGGSITVGAGVQTTTLSLPSPTVTAIKNVSVGADVVTTTTSAIDPTISTTTNASATADVVTATLSLPEPSVTVIKNASVTADVVTVTASLPTPTITTTRSVSLTPDTVNLTASLPDPSVYAFQPTNVTVYPPTLYVGDRGVGTKLIYLDGNLGLKGRGFYGISI